MGYLEKNIDCIKENRPDLYDRVKEVLEKEKYNPEKFEVIDTRDGDKAVQINEAGKTIRLNSLYSPKKEAERWVKQYKFDNIDVSVLMFGLANGAFANAIMNKMKDDAILIIMEPDVSLFIFCLNNFDMTGIISSDRVELYIDRINDENFYFCLHKVINSIMIPNQIICFYPEMEKLYYDKAKEFERAIQEKYSFDMLVAYGLDDVYRKGIDNTLKNLKFVRNSNYITELIGKVPEDVPVIIVAAGPSLSKNVEELKKAEGKAFTLDVRTAAKTNDKDKTKSKSASNITEVVVPASTKCVSKVAGASADTDAEIDKTNFGTADLEKVTANGKVTLKYTGVGKTTATLTNADTENAYDVYVTTDSTVGFAGAENAYVAPASTVTGAKKLAAGRTLKLTKLKDGDKIFIRVAGNAKKKTFASEYGAFGTVKLPVATPAPTATATGK